MVDAVATRSCKNLEKHYTVNSRLVVQKRNIEFQIDQSHSAKLSGLPNAIGQFTFQYCVFVDNQLKIYGILSILVLECRKVCVLQSVESSTEAVLTY